MTGDTFLTLRWNNTLSLIMGIPILGFVIFVLSTSAISDFTGFIWLLGRSTVLTGGRRTYSHAVRTAQEKYSKSRFNEAGGYPSSQPYQNRL